MEISNTLVIGALIICSVVFFITTLQVYYFNKFLQKRGAVNLKKAIKLNGTNKLKYLFAVPFFDTGVFRKNSGKYWIENTRYNSFLTIQIVTTAMFVVGTIMVILSGIPR